MKLRHRRFLLLAIIIFLLNPFTSFLSDTIVFADEENIYYIANDGDDSNDGLSPSSAWKTINKVNSAFNSGIIQEGDDIYFKCGDIFSGELEPTVGGTSGNPLIIGSYGNGEKPILQNPSGAGSNLCIKMWWFDVDNITIRDLKLKNAEADGISIGCNANFSNVVLKNISGENFSGGQLIYIDRTNGFSVENCFAEGVGIAFYGDIFNRLSNGKMLNCTIANVSGDAFQLHRTNSATTNDNAGENFLIQNCTVYGALHDGIDITAGKNVIVDNCEVFDCGKVAIIASHDVENLIIQNCYVHDTDDSGIYLGDGNNWIVRNNSVINSTGDAFVLYSSDGSKWQDEDGFLENATVYNNNFVFPSYYVGKERITAITYHYYEDVFIKNNIFAYLANNASTLLYKVFAATIPPDDDVFFDTNLWYHGTNTDSDMWYNGSTSMDLSDWNHYYEKDIFCNPNFFDADNYNLLLNDTSPCINNGSWLTKTAIGGSGSIVTLEDSSYFSSGHGLIEGDVIFIGDDQPVKIMDVDYELNEITINSSISWDVGENVSLSEYCGSKVDIGRFEFDEETEEPNIVTPQITSVGVLASEPIDTNPSFGWINISCTVADEDLNLVQINYSDRDGISFNASMSHFGGNMFYYNTTFEKYGNYSYFIWANDTCNNCNTSSLYSYSMPPNWDINDDGHCTVLDHTLISNVYSTSREEGWIREDTDNNGKINVLDLILITNHTGESWYE